MQPESQTGLFWSVPGEVACHEHAPDMFDQRWTTEGWQPLPQPSQGLHRIQYQCQHCAATGEVKEAVRHKDIRMTERHMAAREDRVRALMAKMASRGVAKSH
jgi:hypothetical protein